MLADVDVARDTVHYQEATDDGDSWPIVHAYGKPSVTTEPFANIAVVASRQGVNAGRLQAKAFFEDGDLEESIRWYTKVIWTIDHYKLKEVTSAMSVMLYTSRAESWIALNQWFNAQQDCAAALELHPNASKALYCSAVACFHLGSEDAALSSLQNMFCQAVLDPEMKTKAECLRNRIDAAKNIAKQTEDSAVCVVSQEGVLDDQSPVEPSSTPDNTAVPSIEVDHSGDPVGNCDGHWLASCPCSMLLCPPLGLYWRYGCTTDTCISIPLTMAGYVPGLIFAGFVLSAETARHD